MQLDLHDSTFLLSSLLTYMSLFFIALFMLALSGYLQIFSPRRNPFIPHFPPPKQTDFLAQTYHTLSPISRRYAPSPSPTGPRSHFRCTENRTRGGPRQFGGRDWQDSSGFHPHPHYDFDPDFTDGYLAYSQRPESGFRRQTYYQASGISEFDYGFDSTSLSNGGGMLCDTVCRRWLGHKKQRHGPRCVVYNNINANNELHGNSSLHGGVLPLGGQGRGRVQKQRDPLADTDTVLAWASRCGVGDDADDKQFRRHVSCDRKGRKKSTSSEANLQPGTRTSTIGSNSRSRPRSRSRRPYHTPSQSSLPLKRPEQNIPVDVVADFRNGGDGAPPSKYLDHDKHYEKILYTDTIDAEEQNDGKARRGAQARRRQPNGNESPEPAVSDLMQ
ncbi:uncharacterized protein BDR25DRAFT_374239 [Lindgomyces ingoldianus]|uniref:Uncharacterized protein n=1 Tax=Lindgomyces ingoldianus TaxID=673940 RepID=A0ACB6QN16_9PLEO|nr:uncharacterized protein BDR25DRAFT_374239 [Lindgomyces ingoldianus]KAF2467920.1 hypothetical protein BDR25DRAFT_374239 [Lindgomyces ingoldianus]